MTRIEITGLLVVPIGDWPDRDEQIRRAWHKKRPIRCVDREWPATGDLLFPRQFATWLANADAARATKGSE